MIVLREINEDDLKLLLDWKKRCQLIKLAKVNKNMTTSEVARWFQDLNDRNNSKCWIINNDGIKIGIINLNYIDYENKTCTLEYYIGDEHFRKRRIFPIMLYRISKYIFDEMKYESVFCNVMKCNRRSLDICLKYGFEIEGYFKSDNFTNERIEDIAYLKLTKKRWKEIEKNNKIKSKVAIEE